MSKQPSFLRRALHTLRRVAGVLPLTWRGILLIGASLGLFLIYGLKYTDWILLVVGFFGLLLALVSIVSVSLSALWLRSRLKRLNRERQPRALRTDTAQPTTSGFLLPRGTLPFLDFSVTWLEPKAEPTIVPLYPASSEEIRFTRRGRYDEVHRVFLLQDLFGLSSVRWEKVTPQSIEILPKPHAHPPTLARALVDGEGRFVPSRPRVGDRVDTRAYIPGDPIRYIHWKLFARTNEPFVRIPEPAAVFDRQVMSYLACDPLDEFAAEVARWAIENGALGEEWQFGADGCKGYANDLLSAQEFLARSGNASDRAGADLARFLEEVQFQDDQHRLILFLSGNVSTWLPVLKPVLLRHAPAISMIIASEHVEEAHAEYNDAAAKATPWWTRLFLLPQPKPPAAPAQMWQQLRRLSHDGMQLQILHRSDGELGMGARAAQKARVVEPVSSVIRSAGVKQPPRMSRR